MQVKNTMNISNLLNSDPKSEPTCPKVEMSPSPRPSNNFTFINQATYRPEQSENTFREIYNIPSPPGSDYSPKQSWRMFKPSNQSPSMHQLYTPPVEKSQLAFRPRQGSAQSLGSYSDFEPQHKYQQGIRLPSIGSLTIQLDLRPTNHPPNEHHSYDKYPQLICPPRYLRPHGKHRHHHSSRERSTSSRDVVRKINQRRPPKKKDTPHSNAKYTPEQVDYIRYFKSDCGNSYAQVQTRFRMIFPGEKRESDQCFSSRYYRDHFIPVLAPNWELTFNNQGKVVTRPSKIRVQINPEFKMIPTKLVQRLPHKALRYDWVSDEHKRIALAIIEQDERDLANGCLSEEGRWRRAIAQMEKHLNR